MKLWQRYGQDKAVERFAARVFSSVGGACSFGLRGLCGGAHPFVMAALIDRIAARHVVVAKNHDQAVWWAACMAEWLGDRVVFFPMSYARVQNTIVQQQDDLSQRVEAMDALLSRQDCVVVTYPSALCEKNDTPDVFLANAFHIRQHDSPGFIAFVERLERSGFARQSVVTTHGEYAQRGGIVDVYSFGSQLPFRVEFDADQVVSLREFDPQTQLSCTAKQQVCVHARPLAHNSEKTSLLPLLARPSCLWIQNEEAFTGALRSVYANESALFPAVENEQFSACEQVVAQIHHRCCVHYESAQEKQTIACLGFAMHAQPVYQRDFKRMAADMADLREKGYQLFVASTQENKRTRIHNLLKNYNPFLQWQDERSCVLEGFVDTQQKIACYTENDIFHYYKPAYRNRAFEQNKALNAQSVHTLTPGDYVTHIDHGVGVFSGLQMIQLNGNPQEALRILYQHKDVLYVGIHSLYKLSKYSSRDGNPPVLHALGGAAWGRVKEKLKSRIKSYAGDLIKIYAERKMQEGFAFSPDTPAQTQLEASFPYEDTPDQQTITAQIKRDMESSAPMDRLVCGDVGFGKTELAVRAAFKAVQDGKQVGVLVPTTVLALQHFRTFAARLSPFQTRVDYVCRFRSAKDKKTIFQRLADGHIDIVIGTHSLLGKQILFHDLGLLIVDEEQKFGVKAKEALRSLKKNIDCLTFTATPIPRTLQFSLMGARDLSVMTTPPKNRQPVQTVVHDFDAELIRRAIQDELHRGGQVFFVHNHIRGIEKTVALVEHLCPQAAITCAHGQMDARELEDNLVDFIQHRYDVFISTNIIENGVDIPNANTVIVNQAHEFGLSDLHQLRGRVGRSDKKAYCFLLVPSFERLSQDAQQKLRAIEEFNYLGSGMKIAMKDLDIRGSGDILGTEQSGFVNEIGMDAYQKLLSQAVAELRANAFTPPTQSQTAVASFAHECILDTDLPVFIPEEYIADPAERLVFYQRIAQSVTQEHTATIQNEMCDRFGQIPPMVQDLLFIVRTRQKAVRVGIERIAIKQNECKWFFVKGTENHFYQTDSFARVLSFIAAKSTYLRVHQTADRLIVHIRQANNLQVVGQWVDELFTYVTAQTQP